MCFHEYSAYNWVIWKLFLKIFGSIKCLGFKLFSNGNVFLFQTGSVLFPVHISSQFLFHFCRHTSIKIALLQWVLQSSALVGRTVHLSDHSTFYVRARLLGNFMSLPVKHSLKMHNQAACLAFCSCQQKEFIYRFSSCFLFHFSLIDLFCLSFSGASLAL